MKTAENKIPENYITTSNYAPQLSGQGWLFLGAIGGITSVALDSRLNHSTLLSKTNKFFLGTTPFLIGAIWKPKWAPSPFRGKRKMKCKVIQINKRCAEKKDPGNNNYEALLRPIGRFTLHIASVYLKEAPKLLNTFRFDSYDSEYFAIESPIERDKKATHLLRGISLKPKASTKTLTLLLPGAMIFSSVVGVMGYADEVLKRHSAVWMVDWRGIGESDGCTDAHSLLDVEAMVDAAHKVGFNKILFYGVSLGGVHAAHAANYCKKTYSEIKVGCVMEHPFSRLEHAVTNFYPFGFMASTFQKMYPYDTLKSIDEIAGDINLPICLLRGTKDSLMNPKGISNTTKDQKEDLNVGSIADAISSKRGEGNCTQHIIDAPVTHGHFILLQDSSSEPRNSFESFLNKFFN